jgi:hypothetical protein
MPQTRAGPVRLAAGVALALAVHGIPRRVLAAEGATDVETDHLDAADDGGPRAWAVVLRPFERDLGVVGAELGVAIGPRTPFTLEVRWRATDPIAACGIAAGVSIFPTRLAFHGFYVHPRVEAWGTPTLGTPAVIGAGALVGYEWTAPVGATLRLGGGLAYAPPRHLTPELDAAVGWVF